MQYSTLLYKGKHSHSVKLKFNIYSKHEKKYGIEINTYEELNNINIFTMQISNENFIMNTQC